MGRVEEALLALMSSRTRQVETVRATVGDGCGNVAVSGQDMYIWIRPYNRDYPVKAYAPSGAMMGYDTVVIAEVHFVGGATYYILKGTDPEIYTRSSSLTGLPVVGAHALQHMYDAGGSDIVYVHPWQMTPLRLTVTSPESMSAYVSPGEWWLGGTLHRWVGGPTDSLSPYLPSTDYVCYVVVYVSAAFDTLGYTASPEFPDNIYLPSVYDLNIPTPPGAIAAGIVELRSSTTAITTDLVYPIRTIITPDSATEVTLQSVFLAAEVDALYKSTASLYTWTQIGSGVQYLTEGIVDVLMCGPNDWLVFRQQATADSADPLVYRTSNAGLSWAISQTGLTFTQGSDIWKAYATWRDPSDPYNVAVAIGKVGASTTPQVFYSSDGGANWTQVSNTGLPTFTCSSSAYPRCLGVQSFSPIKVCLALGAQGLYFKNGASNWIVRNLNSEDVLAVREDKVSSTYWTAVTEAKLRRTSNDWTSNTGYDLENVDAPAPATVNIYQGEVDRYIFVVAGQQGLHTTWTRSSLHLGAPPIGESGRVLRALPGLSSMLLLTDVDDNLYLSTDGGLSSLMSLGRTSIISADGIAPY